MRYLAGAYPRGTYRGESGPRVNRVPCSLASRQTAAAAAFPLPKMFPRDENLSRSFPRENTVPVTSTHSDKSQFSLAAGGIVPGQSLLTFRRGQKKSTPAATGAGDGNSGTARGTSRHSANFLRSLFTLTEPSPRSPFVFPRDARGPSTTGQRRLALSFRPPRTAVPNRSRTFARERRNCLSDPRSEVDGRATSAEVEASRKFAWKTSNRGVCRRSLGYRLEANGSSIYEVLARQRLACGSQPMFLYIENGSRGCRNRNYVRYETPRHPTPFPRRPPTVRRVCSLFSSRGARFSFARYPGRA